MEDTPQHELDELETIEISNDEVELLLTILLNMNENLDMLNTTLTEQGEETEDDSETEEVPEDETELYHLQRISDDITLQNTILTELSEAQANQEPYYQEQFAETIEEVAFISEQFNYLNETLEENTEITFLAQSSILTYSTFYIPLIIIIVALWWFFKNFLNRIR